jgi:hypothetical protein
VTGRATRALAAGIAVAAVYAASAALSGHLSPLARRPLLDGLAPATPYRWVEPPPELAASNLPPSSGSFRVDLVAAGSRTAVFTTDDAQVSLILARGTFASAPGQRFVDITIDPIAPSTLTAPPLPERIVGNAYRLGARYGQSGDRAPLAIDARVVLVYPLLSGDHGGHEVLTSTDGTAWEPVDTNDLPSIQQADGPIGTLDYVAVASTGRTATITPEGTEPAGSSTATIVIVGALVVLVIGAAVVLRPWRTR